MEKKEVNNQGLIYLLHLIRFYEHRVKELKDLIDLSYSAFLDYVNAKSFLTQLKHLYYILNNEEYKYEP